MSRCGPRSHWAPTAHVPRETTDSRVSIPQADSRSHYGLAFMQDPSVKMQYQESRQPSAFSLLHRCSCRLQFWHCLNANSFPWKGLLSARELGLLSVQLRESSYRLETMLCSVGTSRLRSNNHPGLHLCRRTGTGDTPNNAPSSKRSNSLGRILIPQRMLFHGRAATDAAAAERTPGNGRAL